jgi:hypothetical protein
MYTTIPSGSLALHPAIVNTPIFHRIAPKFASYPYAIVVAIPMLNSFGLGRDLIRFTTLALKAKESGQCGKKDSETASYLENHIMLS